MREKEKKMGRQGNHTEEEEKKKIQAMDVLWLEELVKYRKWQTVQLSTCCSTGDFPLQTDTGKITARFLRNLNYPNLMVYVFTGGGSATTVTERSKK